MKPTSELSAAVPRTDREILALGEAIAETAAILDAVTHRFLTQLRAFDEAGGWERSGALSCAHWLSWRVGMDLGAAREKVRVARKLIELPDIDRALAGGPISYSKVRAMTRVATPNNQADLLTMARTTTGAQLERICRLARQVESLAGKDPRDVEDRQRYVVSRRTDDGMVSIKINLHADEAVRVMKALEVASDGGNLADGAVALAESILAAGCIPSRPASRPPRTSAISARGVDAACSREATADGTVGDTTSGGDAMDRPAEHGEAMDLAADRPGDGLAGGGRAITEEGPVRSPVEVVIHISADTLTGETELGDGISAEIARRLLCDAGVVPLLARQAAHARLEPESAERTARYLATAATLGGRAPCEDTVEQRGHPDGASLAPRIGTLPDEVACTRGPHDDARRR